MAIRPDFPTFNGTEPSFADISVFIDSPLAPLLPMVDIAAVNASTTVEVTKVKGASGGRAMKRTTGTKEEEASLTLYASGWQLFQRLLIPVSSRRGTQAIIGLTSFNIQVLHTPPTILNDPNIYEVQIRSCRIIGVSYADAEGSDAKKVELTLSTMEVASVVDGTEVVLL